MIVSHVLKRNLKNFCYSVPLSESYKEPDKLSENDIISSTLYNRNPRNMEQLRYEPKPIGYEMEDYNVNFWNRLFYKATNKHTSAWVQHNSGNIIVSASTTEWAIAKFLYRKTDVCATMNIARVLADRCLKAGINFVDIKGFNPKQLESEKLKIFCETLEENGLALKEPGDIRNTSSIFFHDRKNVPIEEM